MPHPNPSVGSDTNYSKGDKVGQKGSMWEMIGWSAVQTLSIHSSRGQTSLNPTTVTSCVKATHQSSKWWQSSEERIITKKIRQEEESRGKEKSLVKWCMSLEEGVNLGCCSPSVCVLHCSFCSFLENEAQAPVRFQLQDSSDCTDRGWRVKAGRSREGDGAV